MSTKEEKTPSYVTIVHESGEKVSLANIASIDEKPGNVAVVWLKDEKIPTVVPASSRMTRTYEYKFTKGG